MALSLQWLLDRANRRLNAEGMNRETAVKTRQVIAEMHAQGIYVCVAQGYRSITEQNSLYAQGRTISGSIVTNARGGQSNHNFGVAVDLCLYTSDGSDVIWDVNSDFKKVVAAMKARGFKWGGDWASFKDYPHFELYNVVDGEKIKPWNGDDTIVYTATNVIRYIYTGGFAGAALGEIHDYLFKAGHNFDVKRATDGSLVFLIGPFDTGLKNYAECKAYLDSNGHYNKLLTPEEAANWK
ncbi:M15 family metallopeptidase [Ectobacillus funiculus]|uniref:M15 family metallopeptidase n=1 Tax=Ectobacillus funiculus TaxID=137993 RepID=UPI003979BDE6